MNAPPETVSRPRLLAAVVVVVLLAAGLVWWRTRATVDPAGDSTEAELVREAASRTRRPIGADGPLDLDTVARAGISGTVRDEQGGAIEDARVCATGSSPDLGRDLFRFPTCTHTDVQGRYALEGLLPASFRVAASAPGFQSTHWKPHVNADSNESRIWLKPGERRDKVDIGLEDGGVALRGVVKDLAGGVVEGAWVSADDANTISDADGAFELWTSPQARWVSALAEGYTAAGQQTTVPNEGVEIFLTPESVLVGRVVKAGTDEGVPNAKILASWSWRGLGDTFTDAEGNFRVDGLEAGRYDIEASTETLYGRSDHQIPLGLAEVSAPVLIEAHPAASLEATVVIAGLGEPCVEGNVTLREKNGNREHRGTIQQNDAGTTTVTGILPGTYVVQVRCKGYLAAEDYGQLDVGESPLEPATYEVREGLAIRGKVIDAGGDPVQDAWVRAVPKAGDETKGRLTKANAQSNADGGYELAGLQPGTYEVTSGGSRSTPELPTPLTVELESGADINGFDLVLPASGVVVGTLKDTTGQTLAGVGVSARSQKQTGWGYGGRGNTTTDHDGRFRLEGLEAGEFRIVATRGYFDNLRSPGQSDDDPPGQLVTVTPNEEVRIDLLVQPTDGEITGTVVSGGGPVADAFINFDRMSESEAANAKNAKRAVRWGQWGKRPILTDPDGRFRITGLTPGRYVVQATRKGGGEGVESDVEVGADTTLEIGATGSVSGRVTTTSQRLPPSLSLTLADEAQGLSFSETSFRRGGSFEFHELPAGQYELVALADNGSARIDVSLDAGETRRDIEVALVSYVEVTGRLVDLETGEPVPGMQVAAEGTTNVSWDGNPEQDRLTAADGRFRVERVPTGKGSLIFLPRTWGGATSEYQFHREHLKLADSPPSQDIGDVEIVRTRLEKGEDPGDFGFRTKQADPDTEPEDIRFVVAVVRPGGPAAKAGLVVGDEIVKVDSHAVAGERFRYALLTSVEEGTTVDFELADGKKLSITAGPKP